MRTLLLLLLLVSLPLLAGCTTDDTEYPQSGGWFDDGSND